MKADIIKALSIRQPYPMLILDGLKRYETRDWGTNHRGDILIHAGKSWGTDEKEDLRRIARNAPVRERYGHYLSDKGNQPPLGVAVGIACLSNCIQSDAQFRAGLSELEQSVGGYANGRFAWELTNIRPFAEPIPMKGQLGLFDVPLSALPEVFVPAAPVLEASLQEAVQSLYLPYDPNDYQEYLNADMMAIDQAHHLIAEHWKAAFEVRATPKWAAELGRLRLVRDTVIAQSRRKGKIS